MDRLRLFGLSLIVALALTVASFVVPGTQMMDCERDDPTPCVQVAAGFPLVYGVDHFAVSPVGRVDLLGVLIGEDLFLARNFWADALIWWTAVMAAIAVWRSTDRRQAAAPKA